MDKALGTVIASRTIRDNGRPILIEIAEPRRTSNGHECTFVIQDHGQWTGRAHDSIAALYTALTLIGTELTRANEAGGHFFVAGPAELGFPVLTTDRAATTDAVDIGHHIATRSFAHNDRRHEIRLGRPFTPPHQDVVLCPFQVDARPRAVASGLDSMQALITAIRMIGAWLELPQDWPLHHER
ncbi:DUF6968 family protein [Nocardia brasiliensis]|uniref:DUF6968 family protein n=1 Tax=Nocardia brasiliensis TaxID=37326 RepID=UPI002456FBFA|nr:hypothetical protein [Nocardia brasiliensis]